MPINGFTMGKDVSIDINTSNGPLRLPAVTKFTSEPVLGNISVTTLNGVTEEAPFPKNWKGTVSIERRDSTADDYQAQWEADYFGGVTRAASTITETIQESNGSFSTYRYTSVQLQLSKAGDKAGDKTVEQDFNWTAQRRLKVS
ncbi:hypothetical protein [Pseudomonas sp. PSPC3-3]|uniref:hypothetical protein n=1 Tax=unclassified Pseudomonas TaxID=196821 RepID=UPI003CF961BB